MSGEVTLQGPAGLTAGLQGWQEWQQWGWHWQRLCTVSVPCAAEHMVALAACESPLVTYGVTSLAFLHSHQSANQQVEFSAVSNC
jgi:hypothetical protein